MFRSARLLAVTFAVVAPTALPACGDDSNTESVNIVATAADVTASGVGVIVEGCGGLAAEVGSGVVVQEPERVVTVAHTVAGAERISVVDASGTEFDATVIAFDADADLAILDVPGLDADPLPLGPTNLGGGQAIVWSRDDGVVERTVVITRRLSITIEDIYVENEVRRSGVEIRGDISFGDSGGAIVDPSGRVIGIVYARSRERPDVAFATDDAELERLLESRPLDPLDRCV